MSLTINDYLNFIETENIRRPVYKIDFLDRKTERVMYTYEGDLIDANGQIVNSLNEGVRRTCSFSLKNFSGKYNEVFSNMSIGNKFKIYLGYEINGENYYFPYGVYVFDAPTLQSSLSDKEVLITGTDKWSMLNGINGGILQGTYVVPKDSILGNVIPDILALDIVGDYIPPAIYGNEYSNWIVNNTDSLLNFKTTYDITKDAGSCVSDLLLDLCANANAYVYYNENGRLIVKPYEYDSTKPSIHDFVIGQDTYTSNDINYISSEKKYNYSDLYNAVMVVADNQQNSDVPITAETINMDDSDPNSYSNLGYKKYKMITENTSGITEESQAQERANYELKKVAAMQSNVSISCLPLYNLEVNNIVRITDSYINSDKERFLISSITTPLSAVGTMSIDVVKAKGFEQFGGQ